MAVSSTVVDAGFNEVNLKQQVAKSNVHTSFSPPSEGLDSNYSNPRATKNIYGAIFDGVPPPDVKAPPTKAPPIKVVADDAGDYDDHIPSRRSTLNNVGGELSPLGGMLTFANLGYVNDDEEGNFGLPASNSEPHPYLVLTGEAIAPDRNGPTYTSLKKTRADILRENLNAYTKPRRKKPLCRSGRLRWCCLAAWLVAVGVAALAGLVVALWSTSVHVSLGRRLAVLEASSRNTSAAAAVVIVAAEGDENVTAVAHAIEELMASFSRLEALTGNLNGSVQSLRDEIGSLPGFLSEEIPSLPATSCLSLLLNSSKPSGYYWVRASNGSAVRVYCDMSRSCGNVTGGWVRVASLDFSADTNTSSSCPCGFEERTDSSDIHTCGIQSPTPACPLVIFDTYGIPYTRVCGKVLAYQFGTPNAFHAGNVSINTSYVDGVILTHGSSPRRHIWTFAAALHEGGSGFEDSVCECSNTRGFGGTPPAFVGQDYFCDSGIPRQFFDTDRGQFFSTSPLWDGSGCGSNSTCCSLHNPPWFHKQLPSPTSDPIELRACSDEARMDEDIAISSVEIYVQ